VDDVDIARTLPRPEKRKVDSADSDPQQPADGTGRLNQGYTPDDDDGDNDDVSARENAINMFKMAMEQAVEMEQEGRT